MKPIALILIVLYSSASSLAGGSQDNSGEISLNPSDISCVSERLKSLDGDMVRCEIENVTARGDAVLTEATLQQVVVRKDVGTNYANYTVGDYPSLIRGFSVDTMHALIIEADALETLMPNLTTLRLKRVPYTEAPKPCIYASIGLEVLRELRHLSVLGGIACRNDTINAILSIDSLEELTLGRGHFQTLTKGTFRRLKNLRSLYIIFEKNVTTVEPFAFGGLINLTKLSLKGSGIRHLPVNVFPQELGKLESLDLSNNELEDLKSGSFRALGSLLYLELSNNPITTVKRDAFVWVKSLRNLQLSFCRQLESFEQGALDHLTELRHFDMQGRLVICHVPDDLVDKLNKLVFVDFTGTCIDNLSRANFTHCPNFIEYSDSC